MDLEKIRLVLAAALPMRVPQFDDQSSKERVSALEDYLMGSAFHRGELIEARHWLREVEARLRQQIEELEGYQAMLPAKPGGKLTKADVEAAKIMTAPALFAAGREARKLRESVDDQIERFAFEDQFVISRCYSMISGS